MEPWQLAKSGTEDGEQTAIFCWATNMMNLYPETFGMLDWMYAVANGGSRGSTKDDAMRVGARLKATGVKRGVSDIFLPWAAWGLHGLYIELKKAPEHGGKPSDASKEQTAFIVAMRERGYGACVCCGWLEACRVICQWLAIPESEWPKYGL